MNIKMKLGDRSIFDGIEYTYIETNSQGNFCYDWEDHCTETPDFEELYENPISENSYILYKKDGVIVGKFLNED